MCDRFHSVWFSHLVVFELDKIKLFSQKQQILHSSNEILVVIETSISCMIFYNKVNKAALLLWRLRQSFSYLTYIFKILLRLHIHYFKLCSLIFYYCSRQLILLFHFICYSLSKVEHIFIFRCGTCILHRCLFFIRGFFCYRIIFMNRHQRGGANLNYSDLTLVL